MVIFPGGIKADAVIFDFDGVIVDTEPLHYKAFQRILEPLGLGYSWEDYVETYMGFDDRDAFVTAFAHKSMALDRDRLVKLIATKAEIFQDIIRSGLSAYPGVVELIKALHGAKVPLAICSGALHADIEPVIRTLEIDNCFDIIVTADDVAKSKPDPESYRQAFSRLAAARTDTSLSTDNTVAIEDTPAGIASARGANLQVVAVTNSYTADHLAKAGLVINSLSQLQPISVY